jgi:hypothetical protein
MRVDHNNNKQVTEVHLQSHSLDMHRKVRYAVHYIVRMFSRRSEVLNFNYNEISIRHSVNRILAMNAPHCATLHCATLHCATLCHKTFVTHLRSLCCAVLCCAVLCCAYPLQSG